MALTYPRIARIPVFANYGRLCADHGFVQSFLDVHLRPVRELDLNSWYREDDSI